MANPYVILQWNCNGLQSRRLELDIIIAKYNKPAVICLQETRLKPEYEQCLKNKKPIPSYINIKGYTTYLKCIPSGHNGIAIYVRNDVMHSPIQLNTQWQALAVRVTYQEREFIVSNHYTPGSQDAPSPTNENLKQIIKKFDKPFIMCGDFNAHNTLWSSDHDDRRGIEIEDFMLENDLGILNSEIHTHWNFSVKKWSLLDLSIIHPDLYLDFDCEVLPDLQGSDHCPIIIKLNGELFETERRPRFNFKRANWEAFKIQCRNDINNELFQNGTDKIEIFTDKLLEITAEHIPMTKPFHNKKCSKPWFDEECKAAKRERNKANRLLRRYPCLSNAIKVKVANARARRTFKRKKRESWRNFVSNINSRTPTSKVWNMVRKITGKNTPSSLLHLINPNTGKLETDKTEVANLIGSTFEKNSSSENYSDDFKSIKRNAENKVINFNTGDIHQAYNKRFRLRDLKRSIKKAKDTTPGLDNVHYKLLKNLPNETLSILLDIINEYWDSQTFPPSWREALLLPIPKPGKDNQNPNNFRPIALTSCICKTVERMVNERLIHFLEKNNLLTKFQAGFRAERSTVDQLVRLDTFIKDAFAKGEKVVGVFFDLAKAYDTTWKHGIMQDLFDMGFRGNLPVFIGNFLSDRTFQILLGTTLSPNIYQQEEGVPQGAILSTTLFTVKLNKIAEKLTQGVECTLYVDDFDIFFRSPTIEAIERQLQMSINSISGWTVENGFTVSPNKTVGMRFCDCPTRKCRRGCFDPNLTLHGEKIEFVKEHKFLGLIWDSKLTFKSHVIYLKKRCLDALRVIRVLSNSNWGADRKTLLKLFRSLVRSKLDYGSIVYMSGDRKSLEQLDIIHRHGLRLCLGAFKSSPIEALYVEANEPPLELRREELAMRYALKIKSNPENPVYDSIFCRPYSSLYENTPFNSLAESINKLFTEAEIDSNKIMTFKFPDTPIWSSEPNEVSFYLSRYDKSSTSPYLFTSVFKSEVLPNYLEYTQVYTDGSKQEEKAAFGAFSISVSASGPNFNSISNRISNDSSIFTAEVEAIRSALEKIVEVKPGKDFVIFSDSKSVLECIQNQDSRNPLIINLLDYLQRLKLKEYNIKFCWVPSHVGITGNDEADHNAKEALNKREPRRYKFPYTDYIPKVKDYIKKKWQQRYDFKHQNVRPIKLYKIMPTIRPFYVNGLSRKEECIIHRLRIGHTNLTHKYLMEDPLKREPPCNYCYSADLSVEHILIECQHFSHHRSNHYVANDIRDLFDRVPLRNIMNFLKETGLYNLI